MAWCALRCICAILPWSAWSAWVASVVETGDDVGTRPRPPRRIAGCRTSRLQSRSTGRPAEWVLRDRWLVIERDDYANPASPAVYKWAGQGHAVLDGNAMIVKPLFPSNYGVLYCRKKNTSYVSLVFSPTTRPCRQRRLTDPARVCAGSNQSRFDCRSLRERQKSMERPHLFHPPLEIRGIVVYMVWDPVADGRVTRAERAAIKPPVRAAGATAGVGMHAWHVRTHARTNEHTGWLPEGGWASMRSMIRSIPSRGMHCPRP